MELNILPKNESEIQISRLASSSSKESTIFKKRLKTTLRRTRSTTKSRTRLNYAVEHHRLSLEKTKFPFFTVGSLSCTNTVTTNRFTQNINQYLATNWPQKSFTDKNLLVLSNKSLLIKTKKRSFDQELLGLHMKEKLNGSEFSKIYENAKNGIKPGKVLCNKKLKTFKKNASDNKKQNLQKNSQCQKRPSSSERPGTPEKRLVPVLRNEMKVSNLDVQTTGKKTDSEFLTEIENSTSAGNSCESETYSQALMLQSIAEETNATAAIIEMFDNFIFGSQHKNSTNSEETSDMLLTTTISSSSIESKKILSTSSSVNIAESLMGEVDFHLELENYLKTIEESNCESLDLQSNPSNSYYTALEIPPEIPEENDKSNISFFTASSKGELNQQEGDANFKNCFLDLKHHPVKLNPYKNDNIILATLLVPNESKFEIQKYENERGRREIAYRSEKVTEEYAWNNQYLHSTSWLSPLIYQVFSPLVLHTKLVFENAVILNSCLASESTTSKVLFKNEECSLSNESFKSYVASDYNQDQTEECKSSDFLDEKVVNSSSSKPIIKPRSRSSRRSPSPTIPELIDIYNSILKENIKIRRSFFSSGSNKRCVSPTLFSFLNQKLLEKKQKKDLIKFSKNISHKMTNSIRFRRTKADKRKNIKQLEKYVNIFQRILKSTLSINQIAKINAIMADFKNFPSKCYEELIKCESHLEVSKTPNAPPEPNSKEEKKEKAEESPSPPTVPQTKNENSLKKPNLTEYKVESSKPSLKEKSKNKISSVLECIQNKNKKVERENIKPKERKEVEANSKAKEKVKKSRIKNQSLRGFEFARPTEFEAVMRCLNYEGKKRRKIKQQSLAKKVMMSVSLSGDRVLVEKVWRFSNENLLNLVPVIKSNQESDISDLIVEHVTDKNIKKRLSINKANEVRQSSEDMETLVSADVMKSCPFVSENTLQKIPEEKLSDNEKEEEEEEEEGMYLEGKIMSEEEYFEGGVFIEEEGSIFESQGTNNNRIDFDEEKEEEEYPEIKCDLFERKIAKEEQEVETCDENKMETDFMTNSLAEQEQTLSNFEYNQELLKALHPIDLIIEKSESKIDEEYEASEKSSEIQYPLSLKFRTKHKLSPKIKTFLEQVLNKTLSEKCLHKKSMNVQNISIFNMNKSKSFTMGPNEGPKSTLIISRSSAKDRIKSPPQVKSMVDTSMQKNSKFMPNRKKNWKNLPVRPHTAIICYPSYNFQDNKFTKSKKSQRELKDRKIDMKMGNSGPNRSKEPIGQKFALGQRKKSEEIFKKPQAFADLRKQKSDTGNSMKPEHVLRNSSPCTSGVDNKPNSSSGNPLSLKTSAETILFLDSDLSPGCCSVEFIFNNSSEPPSIHSDASSKNSSASCAAEAFKALAAQRLLSSDANSSSKNIAEAHSPYVMIHSESFLKNCKEPSVHVQNFSESKCSTLFYPGKAQENSKDESPLVTFVLTPNQYKSADVSNQQVKIVQKQRALTNVENSAVVEKKGGKEMQKKKIMEEKKEDENENFDFWTNYEEIEGGLTLDSIEKFIDFLSKKTGSSNKPPNKANERHKFNTQKKPQPSSRPKCNLMTCRKTQCENNFRVKTKKEIAYETWVPVEVRPYKEMLDIKQMKLRGKKIQIEKAADKAVQVQNLPEDECVKNEEVQTNIVTAADTLENKLPIESKEQPQLSLIKEDEPKHIAVAECESREEKPTESEKLEEIKENANPVIKTEKSKPSVTATAINPFSPEILKVITNAINSASNIHNKNEVIELIEKVANTFNYGEENEKSAGDMIQEVIEEKIPEKVEEPVAPEPEMLSQPINDGPKKFKTYKIKIQCITRSSPLKTESGSSESIIESEQKSIELKNDDHLSLEENKENENEISNFAAPIDPKEVLTKKPSTYFDAEELANGDHEINSQTKENSLGMLEETNDWKKKFPTSLTPEDISLISGDFLCKEKEDTLFRKIVKNLQVNNVYYAILLMEGWLKKAEEQKNKRNICAPKIQALLTLIENKSKSLILALEKNNWKKLLSLLEEALQVIKQEDQRLALIQLKSVLENVGTILEKIQSVKGKNNEIENYCTQAGDVKTKPSDGLGSLVLKIRESFSEIKNRVVTNWNKKLRDYRNEPDNPNSEADGDFPYSVHSTQNMFEIPLEFSENQSYLVLQFLKKQIRQQRLQLQNLKSGTFNLEIQDIKSQVASKMMSLEIILSSLTIIQENDIPGPSEECLRKDVEDSFLNFENNNGLFLNQAAEAAREGRLDLKKKVKDLRAPSIMRSLVKVWDTRSFPGSFSSVF